ncbi:MAG: TM0106 family RecB-like putative nuclease [Chloroflexi bacterium]|nr:TM0106 family RecB-like putative nuclease [Chloroflexota bacterium]
MDIEQAFLRFTTDQGLYAVNASQVEHYVGSPINFWCEVNAPAEERDPTNLYMQHLQDTGNEHRADVLRQSYAAAASRPYYSETEGFHSTLEMMANGERHISQMPLWDLTNGLKGNPHVLIRTDSIPSDLGDYSYHVAEVRSARRITDAHRLKAATLNRLLGAIQGFEPESILIINMDGDHEFVHMSEFAARLDTVLSEMREVADGTRAILATHGAAEWPWQSYVNRMAAERRCVSLVSGVGATMQRTLSDAGLVTVDDLAGADLNALTGLRGIGAKTARRFNSSAKAISGGQPVPRHNGIEIPTATTEVFFDFEGSDPRLNQDGLGVVNYLIGAVIRQRGQEPEFLPFIAHSPAEEETVVRDFISWANSLDSALFYHWHNYEKTHLTKMAVQYGIDPYESQKMLGRMVDLHPIATDAYAFPTYGDGLKNIAKYLGFSWRQDDVDGLTTVALYHKYLQSGARDGDVMRRILDYNEDDCMATMYVFDWLRSQANVS